MNEMDYVTVSDEDVIDAAKTILTSAAPKTFDIITIIAAITAIIQFIKKCTDSSQIVATASASEAKKAFYAKFLATSLARNILNDVHGVGGYLLHGGPALRDALLEAAKASPQGLVNRLGSVNV